jgi:hypothetical protein
MVLVRTDADYFSGHTMKPKKTEQKQNGGQQNYCCPTAKPSKHFQTTKSNKQ